MVSRNGISPCSLHLIEGEVGIVEQVLGTRHRRVQTTDADAHGHRYLDGGREVSTNAFGDLHSTGDIGVGEEQGELVPSDSRHQIAFADAGRDDLRDPPQQAVADVVAERVVRAFQPATVEQDDARGFSRRAEGGGRLVPGEPIPDAGERISSSFLACCSEP